jgi:hypothetical protein
MKQKCENVLCNVLGRIAIAGHAEAKLKSRFKKGKSSLQEIVSRAKVEKSILQENASTTKLGKWILQEVCSKGTTAQPTSQDPAPTAKLEKTIL